MALKFLNKKGWHTGSLRNIENVWKAEQKHEAEKRKLEELKKQIHEEREAQEFRLLQEQAGLVPKQERLEFLYDSGLAVGRNSTDDYLLGKPIEEKKGDGDVAKVAAAPGSLFVEEKPQSANDAWRKLHTDPLLLIRQQEQAALARIKNNPVKMDMIKKSVVEKIVRKDKRKQRDENVKKHKEKRKKKQHTHHSRITSESTSPSDYEKVTKAKEAEEYGERRRKFDKEDARNEVKYSSSSRRQEIFRRSYGSRARSYDSPEGSRPEGRQDSPARHANLERRHDKVNKRHDSPDTLDTKWPSTSANTERKMYNEEGHSNRIGGGREPKQRRKLTDEERAARLQEMQNDAEVHEEQRWHRLKNAFDADQREARRQATSRGTNFVNETARSIYGAAQGGSTSVEESVRRRAHFIERSIGDSNTNTFQRL